MKMSAHRLLAALFSPEGSEPDPAPQRAAAGVPFFVLFASRVLPVTARDGKYVKKKKTAKVWLRALFIAILHAYLRARRALLASDG